MGKEWLKGTEADTLPDPAHRRGGWCGVEAGRRELASAAMAGKKTTSVRGLNECKTNNRGGPLWATPRGCRGSTGPGIPVVARERRRRTPVGRCLAPCGSRGASGKCGLHTSTWAACERVGRLGRKRWVEPRETATLSIYSN
jgi:hypothetical protein